MKKLLVFLVSLNLIATEGLTSKLRDFSMIFEVVCVVTKMEPSITDDWIAQSTQYQIISDDELQLAMPDADHGAVFNYNSQTYFLSFGARSNSYGGRFCSIAIVDGEHSDMELLVKNDFQTFKLEDETKIGSSQVTLYRGWLPGFKEDIGMGIQSAPGASVLSIFVAD